MKTDLIRPALAPTVLTSCTSTTTSQVTLEYRPPLPGQVPKGAPVSAVGIFNDKRGGDGATYLGTVRDVTRGAFFDLNTRVPVAQVVANAFGHGMDARGMLTRRRNPRTVIAGDVLALYTQKLVRPYAEAKVRVVVIRPGGQQLFARVFRAEAELPATPANQSDAESLRLLASQALAQVVNTALDDPQVRAALAQ
ncbi:MAG: hypothetical protein R3F11_31280 [Verrucomicrobiales bacterium]